MSELKKLYNENADFKAYIDRCCKAEHKTIDELFSHKIVEYVALSYQGKLKNDYKMI